MIQKMVDEKIFVRIREKNEDQEVWKNDRSERKRERDKKLKR